VHAVRALDGVSDLLVRYGGHPVAAGFTLESVHLPAFAERLAAYVSAHHDDDALVPVEDYDVDVDPRECTMGVVDELAALEPTGKGNPPPRMAVRGLLTGVRFAKERHAFGRVGSLQFVWWDGAPHLRDAPKSASLFGRLTRYEDRDGSVGVRLVVEDGQ
jgi:single-stranded-DNA-specific exonuclease